MELIETLIVVCHVLFAVAVIGLVLLQQGKGADAGAAFGSGASQTIFGSQGSATFLSKVTAVLAALFFVTSFTLAVVAKHKAAMVTDPYAVPAAAQTAPASNADQAAAPAKAADAAAKPETAPAPAAPAAPASDKPDIQ